MHARNRRGAYSLFLASISQKNTKTKHHERAAAEAAACFWLRPLKKLSRSLQDNPFDLSDDDGDSN